MLSENIRENFPFISVIKYGKLEFVGIIINQDPYITSVYDFNNIVTDEERSLFLELGDIWWWESNRTIPINLFLKPDMDVFKHAIKTLNTKDVQIIMGPTVSLHSLSTKKSKRKTIQMVRQSRT